MAEDVDVVALEMTDEFTWGLHRLPNRKQRALTVSRKGGPAHVLLWVPEDRVEAVEAFMGTWQEESRIKAAVEALEKQ